MNNTEIKDRFLTKHKKLKVDSNSYKVYELNIRRIYDYFEEKLGISEEIELIKSITNDHMEDFFDGIDGQFKKNTYNTIHEVARDFFLYCKDGKGIVSNSPMGLIKKYDGNDIKEDKTIKDIPTLDELRKIIKVSYTRSKGERNFDFNSARDRFVIAVLATTGLRIEELLGTTIDDIEEVENGYMINVDKSRVKNNINKRVPICGKVVQYYKEYLFERSQLKGLNSDLLIVSTKGEKMLGSNTNEAIEKIVAKAGVDLHLTNHSFRHFCTTQLLADGVSTELVYKILGWVDNKIIAEYSCHNKAYDQSKIKACSFL